MLTSEFAENLVADWLRNNNFKVINNNDSDKFAKIDLMAIDDNNEYYFIEVKSRRFNANKYPDTLIEKHKYEALKATGRGFYVAVFKDYTIIFDINNTLPSRIGYVSCSKTTDFSNQNITEKEVVYFNINDGIVLFNTVDYVD